MKHYFKLAIEENLYLVSPTLEMAKEIFDLIDSDRSHLRPFLDYVDVTKSVEDEQNYIKMKLTAQANGTDFLYFIANDQQLIGCIDLHFVDQKNKKAEIGYFIHSSQANKGIVTKAVRKVCHIAFEEITLNKVSLIAASENKASNAVALKSGFRLVGTLQKDTLLHDKFVDINQYELLKSDFI